MNLVIVESPTKARTISRFLGSEFRVESSYGHIRDLPKSKLGVDVENNFEPQYVIPTKSRKQVNLLKKEAEEAEKIILATDEDREGEAIAWHLVQALDLNSDANMRMPSELSEYSGHSGADLGHSGRVQRIVFHEITKRAIEEALQNPRDIDLKRVDAQQARRVLDRLVGYSLSPFLWKKVIRGLSAGRVQSVAVRIIVEREREIQAFKPEEYWSIEAELYPKKKKKEKFLARLNKINSEVLDKFAVKNEEEARKITDNLEGAKWTVASVEKKAVSKKPFPPFTTSTLQQDAFRRLGFSAKQTMRLAQQLYEGIELGGEGAVGLCVDEDTLVIQPNGAIYAIKELTHAQGSQLVGLNEKTLRGEPTTVTKFWRIKAPKEMLRIDTNDHERILITKDHPLMVLRDGLPLWVRGVDLEQGDYVAACAYIPTHRQVKPSSLIELLQLLPTEIRQKAKLLVRKELVPNGERHKSRGRFYIMPLGEIAALLRKGVVKEAALADAYAGVVVSANPQAKFQKLPFWFTPELAYTLGLIIGDGYIGDRLNFSITADDRHMLSRLNKKISAVLGYPFSKFSPTRRNYHVDSTALYHLAQVLGACQGKKSDRIDMPNILLTQPDIVLHAYLAGLWDTDGSITKNYRMGSIKLSYSSRSEIFIDKLRLLLKTFNINSSKHLDKRNKVWWLLLTSSAVKNFSELIAPYLIIKKKRWDALYNRYGSRYDDSTISYDQRIPDVAALFRELLREHDIPLLAASKVTGNNMYNYYGTVSSGRTRNPFIQKSTLGVIANIVDTPSQILHTLSRSDVAWKKIESIEYVRYEKPHVYDVTTSSSTFVANGIVSHNCTYMRTDSLNLSADAVSEARKFIKSEFGQNYLPASARFFKTKSKGAQEAHEAIRPTNPALAPDQVKNYLDRNQWRLYDLIWRRFTATQMAEALFDATTVDIDAAGKNPDSPQYIFRANGQTMKFEGFLAVWPTKTEETILPELVKDEALALEKLLPEQHFTQPPPRFSEASLIKALEELGIGRPSTYAPTLATIQDRNYVEKDEQKRLKPTEVGIIVNDLLVEHFPEVVDFQFTAKMEQELDDIAAGQREWQPVIREFYEPFAKHLAEKYETVEKKTPEEATDQICEKCGKPMVIKYGRFGKFLACSGFPECKNAKPLPKDPPKSTGVKCPECGEGEIVERWTRKKRLFFGCARYPDCKYATWKDPRKEAKEKE